MPLLLPNISKLGAVLVGWRPGEAGGTAVWDLPLPIGPPLPSSQKTLPFLAALLRYTSCRGDLLSEPWDQRDGHASGRGAVALRRWIKPCTLCLHVISLDPCSDPQVWDLLTGAANPSGHLTQSWLTTVGGALDAAFLPGFHRFDRLQRLSLSLLYSRGICASIV